MGSAGPTGTSQAVTSQPRTGRAPRDAAPTTAGAGRPRKLAFREQRELAALPGLIERLEAEQSALQARLADPGSLQGNPGAARAAADEWRRLAAELEAAYARWEALESGAVSGVPGPVP